MSQDTEMSKQIPNVMRAIALSRYGKPKEYDIATLPTPNISQPDELLIKVHAASVNPIDVKLADGLTKMMGAKSSFPYKIGFDLAGTVLATGPSVTHFKPGDEVYSRVPGHLHGTIAQYALSVESRTALKPRSLTFTQAASMPLAAQTALQALTKADHEIEGGLKGKTVLVPAALSGTGSFAVQLAKNVFGAKRVVSTLSTGKMGMLDDLIGKGVVDNVVDYTKERDVAGAIGKGSVDFMFDTVGQSFKLLSTVKKGGVVSSISTLPDGTQMKVNQFPDMPLYLLVTLNVLDWLIKLWMRFNGVNYGYFALDGKREVLEALARYADEGRLRPVVGETVKLSDVEGVRRGCVRILAGKGGVGKFVIEID